jgi:hypothetical protein
VEKWQSEYRTLDSALEQWKYNLPSEYGSAAQLFSRPTPNKDLSSSLVMLHAAFHT